ncbi:MAG: hypothetical protein P4L42_02690 [Desulfocapsaceae bacterium]|nr:hypothetical protein [Desulfocapsaceae bacterium]
MHISEYTLLLLYSGFLPLVIVSAQAGRQGSEGFLSLRFLSICFIWVGYYLSPWLVYCSGKKWDSFLLVPNFVDDGLLFSLCAMGGMLAGSALMPSEDKKKGGAVSRRSLEMRVPRIRLNWLVIVMSLSLLAFVISVGGIDQVWNASYFRGEGQFDDRVGLEKLTQMVRVLITPVNAALACMAALAILQEKRISLLKIMGYGALLVSSLYAIHGFSRGAGYPFVILAFLALRLKGKKGVLQAVLAVILALYIGNIGLDSRGDYHPGIGNYISSVMIESNYSAGRTSSMIFWPELNWLDAMAAWTRKAQQVINEKATVEAMGLPFLWNLHPFPSEFVPLMPLGRSLAEVMGTEGSVGLTTPAMAELYYTFGMAGAVFMILIGWIYAYFDRQMARRPGIVSTVCFLMCFISLPIGLHSSMRAMTRPLLYAAVIYFVWRKFFALRLKTVDAHGRWRAIWNS